MNGPNISMVCPQIKGGLCLYGRNLYSLNLAFCMHLWKNLFLVFKLSARSAIMISTNSDVQRPQNLAMYFLKGQPSVFRAAPWGNREEYWNSGHTWDAERSKKILREIKNIWQTPKIFLAFILFWYFWYTNNLGWAMFSQNQSCVSQSTFKAKTHP